MRILAIIPAFNEEANIARVVGSLRTQAPQIDVVVVNDGSSDATSTIARQSGALVLDLPFNLGIGGAVQSGLLYARDSGYDAALQFDGDGQHPANEIFKLIERLARGDADVVIGSRFVRRSAYQGSASRRLGIALLAAVNAIILHKRIADSTSGFRLFNRSAIEFLSEDYPHDFPEPESIVTLCRNGFRVVEEPVEMKPRQGGQSSLTLTRSVYYMLKVLTATLIGATRSRRIARGRNSSAGEHRSEPDSDSSRGAAHPEAKTS